MATIIQLRPPRKPEPPPLVVRVAGIIVATRLLIYSRSGRLYRQRRAVLATGDGDVLAICLPPRLHFRKGDRFALYGERVIAHGSGPALLVHRVERRPRLRLLAGGSA